MRFEIAKLLLTDTHMPVVEIATTFDYADASAFTRAFRRWSETAPAARRTRHGRQGGPNLDEREMYSVSAIFNFCRTEPETQRFAASV